MLLVDANVLLHAVNTDATEHALAREWLEWRMAGPEPLAFAWLALLAFVRVGTRTGILPSPMSTSEALDYVDDWLSQRTTVVVNPTVRHAAVLRGLLEPVGTAGNVASDAHLAALAIEHGATLVSFDRDFSRFPGVRWRHPADDEAGCRR